MQRRNTINVVFIIPTGIGCEIGGHSGDANPVAKLLASVCDTLIVHPNVVNASDINEMTDNMLYVEGSMLDKFLEGKIGLKRVKSNKILVVANSPLPPEFIDAVSAARVTIGIDAQILVLKIPLKMSGGVADGKALESIDGWQELVKQVKNYDFDVLAINTFIDVPESTILNYYENGGINPWGKVEATTSRLISNALGKPVAHAPIDLHKIKYEKIVDPRIAPEMNSVCNLHCVLKGLHKAPQIGNEILIKDIDCMVTPIGCYSRPHIACIKNKIPMISVKENKNIYGDKLQPNAISVESYLEAAGVIAAMRIGITIESVRRPISLTQIF